MKLKEDEFFIIAVSLIEKKQRLLKQNFDINTADLVNNLDRLLGKLQDDHPKNKGIIDLIYKAQDYLSWHVLNQHLEEP